MGNMKENRQAGVVIFDEPLEVRFVEWIENHADCDCILDDELTTADTLFVIAYASSKEFNEDLIKLNLEKYPNNSILKGVSSQEVNYIG